MAVAEDQRNNQEQGLQGSSAAALKAAGAAAATGAAAFAVQRALASRMKNGPQSNDDDGDREEGDQNGKSGKSGKSASLLSSAALGGWDAARDTITPLAEDAAEAAGKYLAEHAPEFVSEHVIPRFIEGFNQARD